MAISVTTLNISISLGKNEVIALFSLSLLLLIVPLYSYCIILILNYIYTPGSNSCEFTVSIFQCYQQDPHTRLIPEIYHNFISDAIIKITNTSLHYL